VSAVQRWETLVPGPSSGPSNAYDRLSETELRQLAALARIRWLIQTGRDTPDGTSRQEADRIVQSFAARGTDADWLLSQREAVQQNRIQRSFNAEVEGKRAELSGLVLPLDLSADGKQFTRFLLTPQLGACSHEPPPPHHQVVLIEAGSPITTWPDTTGPGAGELALSVAGSIRFAPSSHHAYRVDGILRVDASYTVEPDDLELATFP
jgi:hypothetical protein